VRIIAGAYKGRRLAPVKGRTRPTSAMVREAIFNIVGPAVVEAQVLDLFAGTGALGLEALSRGAKEAVFVEGHPAALAVLHRNINTLGVALQTQVAPLPVMAALKRLARQGRRFSLIFLDPPYGQELLPAALVALATSGLLAAGAMVVAEMGARQEVLALPDFLDFMTTRRYGDTQVAFWRARENQENEER
jgi:16S rRNA (guanine(966)-N(2))-methyltransferase RsmD